MTSSDVPPVAACDARADIARARRRAIARDVIQIALLVAVDALFVRWPSAHVPSIGREASVAIVRMMNMAVAVHLWLERALPRWSARRIAGTWCTLERRRFFDRDL